MFGFSLQKLLVLAAIVGAVWYGFKLVSRLKEARKLEDEAAPGKRRKAARRGAAGAKSAAGTAEDMVQCPVCQTYVAARSAGSCGRPDCPY
ncbi:MAG: hypothetical protein ACYTF6_11305 [Planctomycetota bacterium]|jgi:uncharacterized protein